MDAFGSIDIFTNPFIKPIINIRHSTLLLLETNIYYFCLHTIKIIAENIFFHSFL